MKEFKVTTAMTKAYLGDVLKVNAATVKDANPELYVRVTYTLDHLKDKGTTRNELAKLAKEVANALGDKFVQPPLPEKSKSENLVKKASGDEKNDKAPTPRTTLMASVFPETIEVGGFTFTIDHGVKTIKDLSEDKEYEFAFYWAERHLHQFPYVWYKSPANPKKFPNDLDTAQLIYTSDKGVVAYCVSDTTEGAYTIYPRDLVEFEGIRYCNGIEFQIYSRKPDDSEDTEAPETTGEAPETTTETPKTTGEATTA